MITMRCILVPIDFSDASQAALDYALFLGSRFGARIKTIHVVDPTGYFVPIPPAGMPATGEYDLATVALDGARKEIENRLQNLGDAGQQIDAHVELGTPAERILHHAEESGCDLIIMGTHGRKGLARFLLGSVAGEVVKRSTIPVLTVRGKHDPKSADQEQDARAH